MFALFDFTKFMEMDYVYLMAYTYGFGQFFQCLCLFKSLRLLGILEYLLSLLKNN